MRVSTTSYSPPSSPKIDEMKDIECTHCKSNNFKLDILMPETFVFRCNHCNKIHNEIPSIGRNISKLIIIQ